MLYTTAHAYGAIALLALALAAIAAPAAADEPFFSRTITIMNAFPPGGLADLTGRPPAASMERTLKQPFKKIGKAESK